MPWFQRVQLPERFKDATPEQIEQAFKEQQEGEDRIKNFQPPKPEDSDAFKTLQTQLSEAQQNLANITAESQRTATPTNPNTLSKPTSFLEDEDRAFAERANPIINMTLHNTSHMAKQIAVQELRDDADPFVKATNDYVLKSYAKEIGEIYDSMPLQAKTSSVAFKNVVGVVKDRHISDVVRAVTAGKGGSFFEGAGGGGSPRPGDAVPGPEKDLSPGEMRVAMRMHLSPSEYLKAKKGLKIATETTGYAEVKT